jgi:uncharacterized membrane protein YukC
MRLRPAFIRRSNRSGFASSIRRSLVAVGGSSAAFACARGETSVRSGRLSNIRKMEVLMSIEGKAKEAAGYLKEEAYEHGKSPEAKRKAQEGRDLRNEGRIEDGKAPKTSEPGTED